MNLPLSMRSLIVFGLALRAALCTDAAVSADLNTVKVEFDRDVAARTNMPRAEARVTWLQIADTSSHRAGRESAYATQVTTLAKSVATNVPRMQVTGRGSVYALQFRDVTVPDAARTGHALIRKPYAG